MKAVLLSLCLLCAGAQAAGNKDDLQSQLDAFLAGASINDATIHNQFWAQELVYTSSSGTRFGKVELMQGVNESGQIKPDQVSVVYSADDVHIRILGDLALLDFTLVATDSQHDDSKQYYLNSGTFVWRDGRWQALNWQATKKATASQSH